MYTSHKIHTHNKCLCILEMIQKVNNLIEHSRSAIHRYDNAKDDFEPIRLMNNRQGLTKQYFHYTRVKERLVNYYRNTFNSLLESIAA